MDAIRNCRHCGSDLPPEHVGRGRQKQFCSDTCRVKFGYRRKFGVTTNRQRRERRQVVPYVAPQLTEPEKAWLAAMVDAEGWLGLIWRQKKDRTTENAHIFVCVLANTNMKLIDRAIHLLGPSNVYQRAKRIRARFKPMSDVFVNRDAILDFLDAIMPYLIAKRRQAELLMEYCRTHDDLPVRTSPLDRFEEIANECKALNRRGVACA